MVNCAFLRLEPARRWPESGCLPPGRVVRTGAVRDYAEAARLGRVTRARMTQILKLTRQVARRFGLAESMVRAIDLRYLERWSAEIGSYTILTGAARVIAAGRGP